MTRNYRMQKRAENRDETRRRIIEATVRVHDEKGVAPATYSEIAKRAHVGVATVTRHFPTLGELVRACGAHVWEEMRPPTPESVGDVFVGADTIRQRLSRLVQELDAFYARSAHRLSLAARDRDLVPELDQFLAAVDAGVAAMVREALRPADPSERVVAVATAMMSFAVWQQFSRLGWTMADLTRMRIDLLACGIEVASAESGGAAVSSLPG